MLVKQSISPVGDNLQGTCVIRQEAHAASVYAAKPLISSLSALAHCFAFGLLLAPSSVKPHYHHKACAEIEMYEEDNIKIEVYLSRNNKATLRRRALK